MNYYQTLNISVSIQPDLIALKKEFIALSKQFHPDRFGNASVELQQEALAKCSAINMAYATLSNSNKALHYYLLTKEIIVADEEFKLPNAFLMEMMEVNEELEFADITTKEQMALEILKKKNELQNQIIANCNATPCDIKLVKEQYYMLKYYNRLTV